MNYEAELKTAIEAARAAGKIMAESFGQQQTISYKDPKSIVTDTDLAANQAILDIIQSTFPDHSIFSEESGLDDNASEYLWIIDPLDGTTNFSHHIPRFSTAIALIHKQELAAAAVFDPIMDELFSAAVGDGVSLNGQPLNVNELNRPLNQSLLTMSRGVQGNEKPRHAKIYQILVDHARTIRVLNSTALDLCHVAAGRMDAHINNGCQLYDCAAGLLIAMESGHAKTSTFDGSPIPLDINQAVDLLVASPNTHPELVKITKDL